MSATIARQEGLVQLEQSNMRQSTNMAKMSEREFATAAIVETQYPNEKRSAEVRNDNMRGA